MKCLREAFLKKCSQSGQEFVQTQIKHNISHLQTDFSRFLLEFEISENIKADFCKFTSQRLSQFVRDLDSTYEVAKTQLLEYVNQKLLNYLS